MIIYPIAIDVIVLDDTVFEVYEIHEKLGELYIQKENYESFLNES